MRAIKVGSWVHVKLPHRRRFTAEIKSENPDGSFNLTDPATGHVRALRCDVMKPANRPKALR